MDRPRAWLSVYLKGACMGAADTVPGVSGGTIALIVGVYERLITALTALDPRALVHLARVHTTDGRQAFLASLVAMDVPFLAVLGAGVLTSVVGLSTVMHAAIVTIPAPTYAFFAGLIAASAVVLARHVSLGTPGRVGAAVAGFVLAFVVAGNAASGVFPHTPAVLFGAGAVAIVAMILPGVSGAFLLVLLGQYEYATSLPKAFLTALVDGIRTGEFAAVAETGVPVAAFVGGALVGLLTVAHAVRWALSHYREATLAFLVSLMVGALRFPAVKIAQAIGAPTAAEVAAVGLAALVGVGGVLLLDRYTDDLTV